jgi:hypothetical protein
VPSQAPISLSAGRAELEPGALYIVLFYGGEVVNWNWSFYLPDDARTPIGRAGTLFHLTRDPDLGGQLRLVAEESADLISSPLVVAIVRLTVLADLGTYKDMVGSDPLLTGMLQQVPIPDEGQEEYRPQSWCLEAIESLHEFGVLHCEDRNALEREIRKFGFDAMNDYLQDKGMLFTLVSYNSA